MDWEMMIHTEIKSPAEQPTNLQQTSLAVYFQAWQYCARFHQGTHSAGDIRDSGAL